MEIEAETRQSPSVDTLELRHFKTLADEWWDERGKFRGLHAFNPARLAFIVEEVQTWRGERNLGFRPLAGLSVLDIGCGGGILSEPLARLGANVSGIDPVAEAIEVASAHANKQGLEIAYQALTAENLARNGIAFDIVIASEVIEHAANPESFLATCRSLCKEGGLIVLSTINRTAKAFGLVVIAAEHILGLVPRGTHDWKKLIKPEELEAALVAARFRSLRRAGLVFRPLAGGWGLSRSDLSLNYIISAKAV
jgi:2-polyprenyl-6-hydroxyphenyl methylase / 3-demethylubiquinone-9 3-methyltransferase